MVPALLSLLLYSSGVSYVIPTLGDVYCRSDSVVLAVATAVDFQRDSARTQVNGTEFRVTKVLKGPLLPGHSVYSIDGRPHVIGSMYLVFLRSATADETRRHSARPASYEPSRSTRVLTSACTLAIRAAQVQVRTDEVLPGADLVSPEEILKLRSEKRPFLLRETALEETFGRVNCPQVRPEPQQDHYVEHRGNVVAPLTSSVDLIEASIDSGGGTAPRQKLIAICPVDFHYPVPAVQARMQGIVVLGGLLSDGGQVLHLWVIRGINPLLDEAARNGVATARFPLPLVPDGKDRVFNATVRFQLH